MNIKAINMTPTQLHFEGKSKKTKSENKNVKDNNYQQMDAPASKAYSNSLRQAFYAGIAAASILGGASGLASCDKEEAWAHASASSSATAIAIIGGHDCKHDTTIIRDTIHHTDTIHDTDTIHHTDTIIKTIIEPVIVKEYPFALGDSLIAQGLNIGIPLDGPKPNGDDDVVFVASKAFNRYDRKFYETKLDSANTNKEQLSLITKVVDLYSDEPKTSWMKTYITDVPGKGIKFERYVSNSEEKPEPYQWNYAGRSEIRSNGARGNTPGTNIIYDNANNMIWKGEYKKGGEQLGQFLYGQIPVDENGNPYLDDDGKPEMVDYDFDQAKMWSDRVIYKIED